MPPGYEGSEVLALCSCVPEPLEEVWPVTGSDASPVAESVAEPRDGEPTADVLVSEDPDTVRDRAALAVDDLAEDESRAFEPAELPELSEPFELFEPVASANATAGIQATAAPIPNATANAPTRPT